MLVYRFYSAFAELLSEPLTGMIHVLDRFEERFLLKRIKLASPQIIILSRIISRVSHLRSFFIKPALADISPKALRLLEIALILLELLNDHNCVKRTTRELDEKKKTKLLRNMCGNNHNKYMWD